MSTSKLSGKPDEMLWSNQRWTSIPTSLGGVAILLVASCYGNRDKLLSEVWALWLVSRIPFYIYVFVAAMITEKAFLPACLNIQKRLTLKLLNFY